MIQVTIAQAASADRDAILTFLQSPSSAAIEFLGDLNDGLRHLAQFPYSAHRRQDLTPHDVCFWRFANYYLVVSVAEQSLYVLAILHVSRNIRRELRSRLGKARL